MRLRLLSYRCPLYATIRVSRLQSGEPRLQSLQGNGRVQAAGDVVRPGAACHIQGQDSGLQGKESVLIKSL